MRSNQLSYASIQFFAYYITFLVKLQYFFQKNQKSFRTVILQKTTPQGVSSIKQVLPTEIQKEYGQFCSYSFLHALSARYSVLHLSGVLSGGKTAEVARASETEGLLKIKLYRKTIPQSPSATAPFAQGSLWIVRPESLSIFPDKC